jgi:hypothetical protein
MTGLDELLADCDARGIRLVPAGDGGLTIDAPKDALTPDLIGRLKSHKAELLAILRPAEGPGGLTAAPADDHPKRVASRPEASPEAIRWEDCIDPPDPCPKCGSLELWQSAAGDLFGRTPGRWRCLRCDPPTTARRLAELAERIRRREIRRNTTGRKGQYRV